MGSIPSERAADPATRTSARPPKARRSGSSPDRIANGPPVCRCGRRVFTLERSDHPRRGPRICGCVMVTGQPSKLAVAGSIPATRSKASISEGPTRKTEGSIPSFPAVGNCRWSASSSWSSHSGALMLVWRSSRRAAFRPQWTKVRESASLSTSTDGCSRPSNASVKRGESCESLPGSHGPLVY